MSVTIQLSGKEVCVEDIPDHSLTVEDYKTVRANTEGFTVILPKLNTEALIYRTENCLKNCMRHTGVTYDGMLNQHIVPELLKRLGDPCGR